MGDKVELDYAAIAATTTTVRADAITWGAVEYGLGVSGLPSTVASLVETELDLWKKELHLASDALDKTAGDIDRKVGIFQTYDDHAGGSLRPEMR